MLLHVYNLTNMEETLQIYVTLPSCHIAHICNIGA